MKKLFTVLLIGLLCLSLISCYQVDEESSNNQLYVGYISFEKNILYLDEVDWITGENKDRIRELKLSESDMPDGYYIYNPSADIVSFETNGKTVYNFIDWNNDFVAEGEDRKYSTTNRNEFIKYLNTYSDKASKVPFWIEIKDGCVKSITEQMIM